MSEQQNLSVGSSRTFRWSYGWLRIMTLITWFSEKFQWICAATPKQIQHMVGTVSWKEASHDEMNHSDRFRFEHMRHILYCGTDFTFRSTDSWPVVWLLVATPFHLRTFRGFTTSCRTWMSQTFVVSMLPVAASGFLLHCIGYEAANPRVPLIP